MFQVKSKSLHFFECFSSFKPNKNVIKNHPRGPTRSFTFNARASPSLHRLKPTSVVRFSCKKSGFRGGVVGGRTMREMVKTLALKSGRDGEESFRVVDGEGDGLINSGCTRSLPGGFESTLNRLSKWIVSGLFTGLIIWRHDTETLWIVIGSVLNAMLSVALKRILNQERPLSTSRSDPGMPSSHAQSIFFIFSFVIFSIVEWLGVNEGSLSISGLVLASGTYLTWLRVSQQLHTIPQVVVGAAVGSTFFTFWILSWNAIVMEAFDSNLWVQTIVYLGAAGLGLGFALYVIRNWFKDER